MCFRVSVAVILFGMSIVAVHSQIADASKKNCMPPVPTYSPSPPPYHVKKDLGIATVEVLVNERGRVDEAKLLNSSGNDKFDRDALSTVKQWKFKPSLCDGKASSAHIAVQIHAVVR
jgi:TonB family protein